MNEKSIKYWQARQVDTFIDGEKEILKLAKQIEKQYNNAVKEIQNEIYKFYGKYAKENGITITEARKLLDKKELKDFHSQLNEYIEYAKNNLKDKDYVKKLELLKAKTRISRLEELKAKIEFEASKLVDESSIDTLTELQGIYDISYYKNIYNLDKNLGMSINFATPNTNAVTKYFQNGIDLNGFSIESGGVWWRKKAKLVDILNTKIPQGLILGQNPNKVAKIVQKTLGTDYNSTVRLIRTEYSYVLNQCTKDSYKQCGIDRYQILATLDSRTCETCGDLDLKIVNYSQLEVALNYPPFHPNCRCTTIPYFEPDEFDVNSERIAKDENNQPYMVPGNLTFKEWRNGLTEHEGGEVYWQP